MPQLWLNDTLDLLTAPYTAEVGTEFGDWQAITTAVDSLFLDGSVIAGEATGNRTVRLQVSVAASPRWALVEACEALFVEANKPASTLRFVPDEGDAEVYDLFRAQPERTDDQSEAWLRRSYVFSFPALPFVRSGIRQTPAAFAPGVNVEDFEGAVSGALLGAPVASSRHWGMPYDATIPSSQWVQNDAPPTMEAVTNCTVTNGATVGTTYGAKPCASVVPSSDGLVEALVSATFPVGADLVTAGLNIYASAPYSPEVYVAGVEWLDADGSTVRTDWSAAQHGHRFTSSSSDPYGTIWVTAARPSAAVRVRLRLRIPDAVVGDSYPVCEAAIVPGDFGAVSTSASAAFDGTAGVVLQANYLPSGGGNTAGAAFLRVALSAPVGLSEKNRVQAALYGALGGSEVISARLTDLAGRWSLYEVVYERSSAAAWQTVYWTLSEPLLISDLGPADLSAVSAVDILIANWPNADPKMDSFLGVVEPTATTSDRGTVYDLGITGAARSPVRLSVAGSVALTDWLVATADPAIRPMLAVTANVATAETPAAYDGVYRVIGALAPASAETNPTCTVAQLIDGVQVASQVLDGTLQDGNHYVDFGVCPLPMVGVPTDNSGVSYTFTLSPADTDWSEVLVLDMARPVAWLPNIATPMAYGWIDEPEPTAQMGRVWVGSTADRSDARSPADPPDLSLPFSVRAPGVQLLVYSTSGAPDVSLSYYPRRLS